jgi:two-component system, OmpR family, sensor histidine kinase TctE
MNFDYPASTKGTLRRRLLVVLLLPLIGLLIVSLAFDYSIAFEPVEEAYDHALSDDALALAGRIRYLDSRLQMDFPAAAEAVLRTSRSDEEFLSIYGPSGELLTGDADLRPNPPAKGKRLTLSDAEFRGKKVRKASYRLNTAAGEAIITVAETTHKRERTGSKILAGMLLPNILLIIASLVLVYIGVRSGLAPLTQLSDEISRRAPHDLSPLPKRDIPAEAEPLVKAIDGLIEDLRSASAAQQAFLANAAHQLKTPLAGLQAQLELHAQELPGEYTQRAKRLLDATRRLGHLTHQLLALARSAPEANHVQEKRPVDLAKLLESSASAWFDQALVRNIDLGFEAESVGVSGSEWMLREMLGNLIDNAIRYTPDGGKVTVRSGLADGRPFIAVEDNGPGIPADQQHRIFERFYRLNEALAEGSGLGLAIVKEVADRHGAEVRLTQPTSGTGTEIQILFPQSGGESESAHALGTERG